MSGASNSFSIQAENRFSVLRFHEARSGQSMPGVAASGAGLASRTAMSRVIFPQVAAASLRVSVACQVPAAGEATSANQT